jgi:Cd2+/Zn2+-exporting ATPase
MVFKNICVKSNIFDESMLMSVSTIGAFIIGSYFEGVLVMLLSQVGDILQEAAVNKSRKAILNAIDLRPVTANKL